MKKPIIIYEPHSDDAYLSLGSHVERWVKQGRDVTVVTVYLYDFKKPSESRAQKRAKEAQEYADKIGFKWKGLWKKNRTKLKQLDLELPEKGTIIFPLGIQHPDHIHLGELASRKSWRYLDVPYLTKQKNTEEINLKLRYASILSFLKPNARKWKHSEIFKTQSTFFYFNMNALKASTEMIVKWTY